MYLILTNTSLNIDQTARTLSVCFLGAHVDPSAQLMVTRYPGGETNRASQTHACTFAEFDAWLQERDAARVRATTPLSDDDMRAIAQGKDIRA